MCSIGRKLSGRVRGWPFSVLAYFALALTINAAPAAMPGSLDTTFHSDGIVTTDFGAYDYGDAVALQADGKIVVAGTSYLNYPTGARFAVLRYDANGNLDASFGTGGKVITTVPDDGIAYALAIQPDGKIIVAGQARASGATKFAIVRYNTNGSLDGGFGTGGQVLITIPDSLAAAYAVAVQSDGRILVGGVSQPVGAWEKFTLARLNANGALDSTFGVSGIVTTVIGTRDYLMDVALQKDGKIVAIGQSHDATGNRSFVVTRHLADGSLDTSFDGDGKVTTTGFGFGVRQALAAAVQRDGKIVVAGTTMNELGNQVFAFVRYNPDGSLDPKFDDDGIVLMLTDKSRAIANDVAVQPDGKILAAGYVRETLESANQFAVVRMLPDGTPDRSFDLDGVAITGIERDAVAMGAAIESDGRAAVAGYCSTLTSIDFVAAEYYWNVSKVANFDGDIISELGLYRYGGGWWVKNLESGEWWTTQFGVQGDLAIPADYDGDGRTDIAVWRHGALATVHILASTAGYRTEQFGQTGDEPVVGDWDGDGRADIAVYRNGAFGALSYFFYRGSYKNPTGFTTYVPWGTIGDIPVRGDFDGDGRMDPAIFRPSEARWYVLRSMDGVPYYETFGTNGDLLVPADYDGDGIADIAVYRDGSWYIRWSSNGMIRFESFGLANDTPAPADFDGDSKADIAVYRGGTWIIRRSSDGIVRWDSFGLPSDGPLSCPFPP